jgi:uncharacterized repeat protein (TIGR01451 family)
MRIYVTLLFLALLPAAAPGQAVPPPIRGPNPLLHVRFSGPAGMHVTFYQGRPQGHEYAAPVVAGLRPGYIYRVKLSDLPELPGVTLYPTLEVRGTLHLLPKLNAADYPAPVTFTPQDIERALAGSLITKVVYLENPDRAAAVATRADQPLELDIPPRRDPLAESREYGRPVLIVRLGERDVTAAELAGQSIPGTILLPGEKVLPLPRVGPCLPWAAVPFYDPLWGPKPPEEECLRDGGDAGQPVGYDRNGQLYGLEPMDTVAEYKDSKGRRGLAISNRVCLCVPRFAVIRHELPLARYDSVVTPSGAESVQGQAQLQTRVPSLQTQQNEQLKAVQGRQRPSAAINSQAIDRLVDIKVLIAEHVDLGMGELLGTSRLQQLADVERLRLARQMEFARRISQSTGPHGIVQTEATMVVGRVEGLDVVSAVAETRDLTVCCNEPPRPPDKPLCLYKWADKQAAQVGDVVTFFLKYSNQGGQPITDVAVSDSLSGRLEYIPGSAQSDRNAVFTTQQNEAGSLILRWEISGRLLPGDSGVVRFQARVR